MNKKNCIIFSIIFVIIISLGILYFVFIKDNDNDLKSGYSVFDIPISMIKNEVDTYKIGDAIDLYVSVKNDNNSILNNAILSNFKIRNMTNTNIRLYVKETTYALLMELVNSKNDDGTNFFELSLKESNNNQKEVVNTELQDYIEKNYIIHAE